MANTAKNAEFDPEEQGPGKGALEAMQQGARIIRLENAEQAQIALQHPRDEVAILEAALTELETYKSLAEAAIYSKPVGRMDKCPECGAQNRGYLDTCANCRKPIPMKFARDLSIRAAESLANRWNNSCKALQIISEDEHGANIAACFLDYESNIKTVLPARVSKWIKRRSGKITRIPDDRFNDVVLKAAGSKLLREAILRSIAPGLRVEYREKCEEILRSIDPEILKKMEAKFAELDPPVSRTEIEAIAGKQLKELKGQDIVNLRGAYNALKEGETTLDQLLGRGGKGDGDESPKPNEPVKGAPSVPTAPETPPEDTEQKELPKEEKPEEKPPEGSEQPKRRRGRPKGSKNKSKTPPKPETEEKPEPEPQNDPEPPAEPEPEADASEEPGAEETSPAGKVADIREFLETFEDVYEKDEVQKARADSDIGDKPLADLDDNEIRAYDEAARKITDAS